MPSSKRTAIFGVLIMLVAAVAPAMAAATPAGDAGVDAVDDQPTFDLPDDEDENETDDDVNETDDDDVNETDDDDVNETDDDDVNETNETSSSAEAAALFTAQLQQVIENATNNSSVEAPGRVIASYVVANNPGNAPDHAGPPNGTPGASGNESDGTQGPPENAGGPPNGTPGADGDGTDGNETDGDGTDDGAGSNGNGNGPKAVVAADGFDAVEAVLPRVELAAPFDALD